MTNNYILDQLRYRRDRIMQLTANQTDNAIVQLLTAELHYVDAMIDYRERHGDHSVIVKEIG